MKLKNAWFFRIFLALVCIALSLAKKQADTPSQTSVAEQDYAQLGSLADLQDLSFPALNRGILYNLVNTNLSRYGSHRTVLNYLAKQMFTVKPILHPWRKGQDGLELSVFLLPQKDYSIHENEIYEILQSLLVEINNTLAYFGKSLSLESLRGNFLERLADGSEGRRFKISDLLTQLSERRKRTLIADRILAMHQTDFQMRLGQTTPQAEVRKAQIETLKKIVSWIGWPTTARVGAAASHAAWALTQHADFDLEFQKTALKFLLEIHKDEVNAMEIAYLSDRIRVAEGQHQIYGTQYVLDDKGQIFPRPIEDFSNLDKRRKNMGLEPFNEYLESLYRSYGTQKKTQKPDEQTEIK